MLRIIVMLVFITGGVAPLFGQYSLEEAGVQFGGSAYVPMGYSGAKPAMGYLGGIFYSHYACGKRYGMHGSLGLRHSAFGIPGGTAFPPQNPLEHSTAGFNFLEGSFCFKIRKNEYHRPAEAALLAGMKFSFALNGKLKTGNTFTTLSTTSGGHLYRFNPGLHVSVWLKRKIGQQSLYLQPGIEFYPFPVYSNAAGDLAGLHGFMSLGYSLWNSHQRRKSKG